MKLRTLPIRSGYTMVEIMVAAAAFLVLMAGVVTLVYSTNILTFKTVAVNSTGASARITLDQVQSLLRQAYTAPIPLDANGAVITGTLNLTGSAAVSSGLIPVVTGSTGIVTGTGAGIKFHRYVGGPYMTLITNTAGLSGSATSLSLELDTAAQVVPPLPQPGDTLVINTTALLSGNGYQVWATVSGSASLSSSSGTKRTYNIPLTPPLKDKDGNTVSGIGYVKPDTAGNPVNWSTSLLRPTALLLSTRKGKIEMGLLEPCVASGTSGAINTGTNYTTLTTEIDTDTKRPSCFSIATLGSAQFVGLVLRIRSSEYDNYFANKQFDSAATYMGLSTFIELKSIP